jgi:KDO2-lipid IV(A) lauroyltransferase
MVTKERPEVSKGRLYALRYRIGEYLLRGFVGALPLMPPGLVRVCGRGTARLLGVALWRFRRRMEQNVAATLGRELPARKERKALVWRAWMNFARGMIETSEVLHSSREHLVAAVGLDGEEHIARALEQSRGVLALSAHLGGFTLIAPRLAAAGFPVSVVVKQPADRRLTELIDGYRARVGVHTISAKPRREAVRGVLKALRDNRIVLIVADEFKSGDVMVDFLGLQVPAPRGPATLALRTGAVTLPVFAVRAPEGAVTVSVGAPIPPAQRGDLEESVLATTAVYTRHLEAAIRAHPEQWNWFGLPRGGHRPSRSQKSRQRKILRTRARPVAEPTDVSGSEDSL